MNSLRLYMRYISLSFRSQMQYRASFLMQIFGNIGITATEFLGIWALFVRFGSLTGWTLPQAALLYAMSDLSFSIAEAVPRGFDIFPSYVKSGDFDRVLLRPRSGPCERIPAHADRTVLAGPCHPLLGGIHPWHKIHRR